MSLLGPDTKVVSGDQVPKRSKDILRDLDLVQPGESLTFLYSAATVVPIDEILEVSVTYSDSFWADTAAPPRLRR